MENASFKDLISYKKAFALAMEVFELTKQFPKEEKYSLIDQIRRSSRAVCSNIAEAYRKRQYPAHFVMKMSDADMENSETQVWLDFSLSCDYIDSNTHIRLVDQCQEVGRLLHHIITNPNRYTSKS